MKIIGKMSQSSRRWLDRQRTDPYVKQAINDGYRSRAAYKLLEIDNKFHIIKNAKFIIDLGAAPGGWSQVLSQRSPKSKIASVDLLKFDHIDNVRRFTGNFEDSGIQNEILEYLTNKADLIVSDMAPSTVGHRQSDHLRIMRLVESAYYFARRVLQNKGTFIVKIFHGEEEKSFFNTLKQNFQKICFFKPQSSRKESTEIYVIALQYNGNDMISHNF